MTTDDINLKRLRWHSRRGMLELDHLLEPFLAEVYQGLAVEDQRAYAKLLDQEDPILLEWFSLKSSPEDPDLKRIVRLIMESVPPR